MIEGAAADLQRVGDVGELDGLSCGEMILELRCARSRRFGSRAESSSSCSRRVAGADRFSRRCLLEHHVRVRAADAERAHAGAARRGARSGQSRCSSR